MKQLLNIIPIICILFAISCKNTTNSANNESDTDSTEAYQGYGYQTYYQEEDNEEETDYEYPSNDDTSDDSYSFSSTQEERSKYDNYEETSSCVDGIVVYEGRSDYFIVETQRGYTVLETHGGFLSNGDRIRGELNSYNFKYIIKTRSDSEVRVYIEDYMLSKDRAVEWLGRHNKLKYSDQEIYDNNND